MRDRQEVEKELEDARIELQNVKGKQCEVYTRIVGYYRSYFNFNAGKADEYKQRKAFVVPSNYTCD